MKLYIPTTTLNFNNILSSETISPKVFYGQRGYGYKTWENVAENDLENGILLYKQPFKFTRPANGLDDYPMLIELELEEDELEGLTKCGDWGYMSSRTLSLTPRTARLIFFSEEHRRIALSKSEGSSETKLTGLYRLRLAVENYPEMPAVDLPKGIEQPDLEALDDDRRKNKMKGFLYGYVIGRMLSRTKIGVSKLNAAYKIRDIVGAVMSSIDKKATVEQEETLRAEYLNFDPYYHNLIDRKGKGLADEVYAIYEEPSSCCFSKRMSMFTALRAKLNDEAQWKDLQEQISDMVEQAEKPELLDYNIFGIDGQPEVAVTNCKLSVMNVSDGNNELYKMLVNDVFSSIDYDGKVNIFRKEIADDLTKRVKFWLGEEWESSSIRTYLNAMRHYVAGEVFTQPWDNVVLSSITAVIMKGEDWEGLFRFMVSKGMCDYRYAFGLYGALNGFANLTRDFTDILFASENKQYTWKVYKEIHRQLTGVELHEALNDVDILLPEDIKESKISQGEPIKKVFNTLGDMKTLFESKGVKSIKGDKLKKFEHAYYDASGDYEAMLEVLKSERGWKDDCRRLLKDVGKLPNKVSKVVKEQQQRTIEPSFDFQIEPSKDCDFYNDVCAYDYIYPLLNTPEELKQMRIDLSWFQNNYKDEYLDSEKGQYKKGRYCDKPNDNKSVLEHWENFLWRKKTKGMDWEQKIYAHVDIDRIISELKNIYLK